MKTYYFKKFYIQSIRNNVKKQILFCSFLTALFSLPAAATDWAVLLYFHADGSLQGPAYRAAYSIVPAIGNFPSVKFYIELYDAQGRTRFESNGAFLNVVGRLQRCSIADGLREACSWAFAEPSKYTMLLMSGHGTGILEPHWDPSRKKWFYQENGDDSYYFQYQRRQSEQLFDNSKECHHKSLFLNTYEGSYLPLNSLTQILKNVTDELLMGKKIDIVGFDACHMAMIEIAFALEPYAQILVASQECEEKSGWNYETVVNSLRYADPIDIARSIVYGYEVSQKIKEHDLFSLSALKLCFMRLFLSSFCTSIHLMRECLSHYGAPFKDLLCAVRQKNQRFCSMPMYADLLSYLIDLHADTSLLETSRELEALKKSLLDTIKCLRMMIAARVAGNSCHNALGCSIYFPYGGKASCYENAAFAQNSPWPNLLSEFDAL